MSAPWLSSPWQPRAWLAAVIGVLVLVLLAIGYVQWRQFKLLDSASHYQNDALGWSFSQLETEQLRLRTALNAYLAAPTPTAAEQVQLRYDIFVSRLGLVDHERAAGIMGGEPAYGPAIAQVHEFVRSADRQLGATPVQRLDAASGAELAGRLAALNAPLHELSLGASHLLYQRATERNAAVRQQSQLSIALTAFQCLLLLVLAGIVLRQVRTLLAQRHRLQTLADNLCAARHDAEAASRAKSVFLANMSHEIRTPFHGMLGMMSLLQEGGLTPQQAAYLDTARESAHHLLTILNDILDISQLESGRLQVVPQTVDLPQLIAQVDALMGTQAHAKGLSMRVEVAPDVPRWVHADPTRVKQILFNLLSNAVKFTPTGGVTLGVTLGAENRLQFRVTDSGVGMDAATQARLFQRFVQGDPTPARRANGAGLGLEISRDLARLMGGDITVSSEPGTGSIFVATLPLPSVAAPSRVEPEAPALTGLPATRSLRVLVAEDHPVNRAYLEAVLDKLGHRAVFAVDGNGVLEAIAAARPGEGFDLVLMDLHMPGMDGFAAARSIRAMPPPLGRLPIVALTADAFQASRQLALEAGMNGFLTKPAHLPQLREVLARHTGDAAEPPAAPRPAASGPATSDDIFDAVTLEDLQHALAPPKYAELLGSLLGEQRATLEGMRRATAEGARIGLAAQAHSLKGAALSLGLQAIGRLAGQVQSAAAVAGTPELHALVDRLDRGFEATRAAAIARGLLPAGAGQPLTPPAAPARA